MIQTGSQIRQIGASPTLSRGRTAPLSSKSNLHFIPLRTTKPVYICFYLYILPPSGFELFPKLCRSSAADPDPVHSSGRLQTAPKDHPVKGGEHNALFQAYLFAPKIINIYQKDPKSAKKNTKHLFRLPCVKPILFVPTSTKNDRRNSGGTLRQKFNLIDIWHLTFDL